MDEQPLGESSEGKSQHNQPRRLKPKELQAAALLAAGMKQGDVASALGVSRTTIYRYEERPGFSQAKEASRAAGFERLVDRSWSILDHSLDVIEESLVEKDPQTALGYFKTMAPGLRDVRRVEDPEPLPSTELVLPAVKVTPAPEVDAVPGEAEDRTCTSCGRLMRSPRGLAQHVRLMHPLGGGA